MADRDYDEKRNFVRMNIETQITYKVKNSDGQSHHGVSGDLSATGLYMVTDFALKEGEEIELVMNTSNERLPPFVAEGIILRTSVDENNKNKFHVSIQLTQTE